MKEESFLPAGKSARWRGDQSGQRGRFRALDENTTCLQQLEWRETCTDSQCLCPHSPVLDARLLGTGGGWVGKGRGPRTEPRSGHKSEGLWCWRRSKRRQHLGAESRREERAGGDRRLDVRVAG